MDDFLLIYCSIPNIKYIDILFLKSKNDFVSGKLVAELKLIKSKNYYIINHITKKGFVSWWVEIANRKGRAYPQQLFVFVFDKNITCELKITVK